MKKLSFLLFVLMLIGSTFLNSCKEDKPPVAQITVVDKNGTPVSGATVKVYCSPSPCSEKMTSTQTSDASGITTHEFPYEAVLKILATAEVTTVDNSTIPPSTVKKTLTGEGYVTLKLNETAQETVTML